MVRIDFQTQILPERLGAVLPEAARTWGKFWSKPVSRALHEVQPWVRFLPPIGRSIIEELGAIAPLSMALFESTLADLKASCEKNRIDRCVILSNPLRVPNARLLDIAESDAAYIAAIRVPTTAVDATSTATEITAAHARGCRILHVHPASDGIEPNADFYLNQIAAASERGWIVLIQTGAPKVHLVYRKPEYSEVRRFENWLKTWPKTSFVIARMGFHHPDEAMDLAEQYPNTFLETSWQPRETIAEAVRRVGADRVLFGSDWPLMGQNQRVGIRRIQEAISSLMISEEEAALILGGNADRMIDGALNGTGDVR